MRGRVRDTRLKANTQNPLHTSTAIKLKIARIETGVNLHVLQNHPTTRTMSVFESLLAALTSCASYTAGKHRVHISQCGTRQPPFVPTLHSVEPGNLPLCPHFTVWNQAIFNCVHISQCGTRQSSIVSIFHSVEPGSLPLCPHLTLWNQAIVHCVHISQCGAKQSSIVSTFHSVNQAIFYCVHISQCETRNRPLCPHFTV